MFTKPSFLPLFLGVLLVPLVIWIAVTPAIADDSSASRSSAQGAKGYVPPGGFVPDSATAVRIAVAVWIPIYGAAQIRAEQPYVASLKNGVWTVTGTLPRQYNLGGTAVARIAKKDGRILFVIHYQ
jgi:NTF2 fold immunity protein